MRFLLLFFSLIILPLFADPKDPYQLAVTEGEPSALVAGCVNAITGDLYFNEEDVIVQGYIPLRLPRHYISGDGMGKMASWSFLDHLEAKYKASESEHEIKIWDPNGSSFTFRCSADEVQRHLKKKSHTPKFRPPSSQETPGLTNTASGEISAKHNLKNACVRLEGEGKYFTVYCSDQTTRRYKIHRAHKHFKDVFKKEEEKKLIYLLESETLPSGHKVIYQYDQEDRLTSIRTTNPSGNKTYASAAFRYLHRHQRNGPDVDIELSDGRTLRYRFEVKDHSKVFLLKAVISPDSPEETFYYHPDGRHYGRLICRTTEPDNRFLDIEYYHIGHNDVGGDDVKVHDKNDPKFLRVKTLKAPVGTNETPHITHRFFYDPASHATDVRHNDNSLTKYCYSETMRLEAILRYDYNDVLSQKETFEWTSAGELLSRNLYDPYHNLIFSRRLHYDDRGNVIREELQGDLSGRDNPREVYTIHREYSRDGRDLLLKEQEQNGKTTHYSYFPNSNLLASRLECDRDQIKFRTFYEYSGDHVLTKEIRDDGETPDKDNLTGVKTRTIKAITPMPNGPYVDMPHVIEEKFWNGQQEELLKKTVLSYTTGGRIAAKEIYDAHAELRYALHFEYDQLGRLVKETDALGQSHSYAYDAAGNKIVSSAPRRTGTISYDCSNRPTQFIETGFDGISHATHYTYDGKNRKTSETDPFGNTTRYLYNGLDQLVETHLPQLLNEEGQPTVPAVISQYDAAGREILRKGPKGHTTQTAYNARSQAAKILYPDGSLEQFHYNSDGTLSAHIDRDGLCTKHTYDPFGRRTSTTDPNDHTTTFNYDGFQLMSIVDAEEYVTNYTYDCAGRKIKEERNWEQTEYAYDSLNRLHIVKRGDLLTITEYDNLDRIIEERQEDIDGRLIAKETYSYDEAGNRTSIARYTKDGAKEEKLLYDSFDRLCLHQDPLGYQSRIEYCETYQNSLGQHVLQKQTTDPLNRKTIETYDSAGRLASIEIINAKGSTCSLEARYYDLNNNLSRQVSTLFPQGTQQEIRWRYDSSDRLVCLVEPQEKTTLYAYTPNGLLKQTRKPDGMLLHRDYDRKGNLISLASSDGAIQYLFSYNKIDQLYSSIDLNTKTATFRTLDPHGRIIAETLANQITLSNRYDLQGRRCQLILPDASTVSYCYDPAHLKEVVRYDSSGNRLYSHFYQEYDLGHRILSQGLIGNLGTVSYTTNAKRQRTSIESPYFSQVVTVFDPIGNICEMQTGSQFSQFVYDDLDQLVQEEGCSYLYDSHFNRLAKNGQAIPLNSFDQLATAEYDPNGNPVFFNNTKLTYDPLDRLISIETPDLRLEFAYDTFHRRISKKLYTPTNGERQLIDQYNYIYDGQNEIGSTDASGKIRELRILGAAPTAEIGATVAIELEGQIFAPISDLQGNIAALVSLNGSLSERYHYTSFGEHTTSTQLSNPWRFSSKRHDETGLVYFGRRYYDPVSGRWLNPDPIGYEGGINLYAFVRNNPLTHRDLYGLIINPPVISLPPISTPPIETPWVGAPQVSTKQVAISPLPSPQGRSSRSKVRSAAVGIGNGLVNFTVSAFHDLHNCAFLLGAEVSEFLPEQTSSMMQAISEAQFAQLGTINSWIASTFSLNPNDPIYNGFRDKTTLGLEVASLITGGYAAAKGVVAFNKLAKVSAQAKFLNPNILKTTSINSKPWSTIINPFKGKSFEEIDNLLLSKGFTKKGPDPLNGKGSYFSPVTNRKFYLDHAGKTYKGNILELPHVDVHYNIPVNGIEKQRLPLGDYLYEHK
ncbi:MAG: RHS repeat-associated core domain-containing protein [Parachlamydiales bacterium]